MLRRAPLSSIAAITIALLTAAPGSSAEIKVLATGATKSVLGLISQSFTQHTGHTITLATDTAGGVAKRVEAGEAFDVAIATKGVVEAMIAKGRLGAGTRADVAQTSIGVAVKEGAAKPDISTLEAFKQTLLAAKTIAYVDPASGGTSGIYIAGVLDRLGLSEALKPKLRLKAGGYVAELVASGEAEIAIHQVSEILPVKGVVLLGGLPKEIQSITVYSGGLPANATNPAKQFLSFASGPESAAALQKAGMEKP